ncbi:MAG: TldD/PmbA family protein [Thermoleophilia bacterium]
MVTEEGPNLPLDLVERVMSRALARGGDFTELFAEARRSLSMRLEDGRVETVSSGEDRGASVRLVRQDSTAFGYTEVLDEPALLRLAEDLSAGAASAPRKTKPLARVEGAPRPHISQRPGDIAAARKADVLRTIDQAARDFSPEVRQVIAGYSESRQRVMIANSRGILATDDRTRVVVSLTVVAQREGVIQTGYETLAHHGGYDLIEEADLEAFARSAAEKAVVMLGAREAPAGRMPIVLANGFGGVLFHEACGHGLEADFILKKTSIWEGRLGQRVAEEFVTAYDDAYTPGLWGSAAFDDEGTPSQKTAVVEEGILTAYLSDLLRGERLGAPLTGNGRRQSFRHLPYPRMTNTYFAPGDYSAADLIADTPRAFYAKSLSGGQVDPATGDFVFGVSEGYLIENGRIGSPVKGATLIGNGAEVLRAVDAIADDLDVKAGTCGKEGQGVPVGTGQPTLRLRELTVGGTSV